MSPTHSLERRRVPDFIARLVPDAITASAILTLVMALSRWSWEIHFLA
jgi:hypothetical protein